MFLFENEEETVFVFDLVLVDIVFVLKGLKYRHEMIIVNVNFLYKAHFKKAKVLSSKN